MSALAKARPQTKIEYGRPYFMQAKGDTMAPALRPAQDFALCVPINAFDFDGIYLVRDGLGEAFFRVQSIGFPRLRMYCDNSRTDLVIGADEFERHVVAKVCATLTVQDERPIKHMLTA